MELVAAAVAARGRLREPPDDGSIDPVMAAVAVGEAGALLLAVLGHPQDAAAYHTASASFLAAAEALGGRSEARPDPPQLRVRAAEVQDAERELAAMAGETAQVLAGRLNPGQSAARIVALGEAALAAAQAARSLTRTVTDVAADPR